MSKDEYLAKIKQELDKYELTNYYDLLYQASEAVEKIIDEDIEEVLGTAKDYVERLFKTNEIKSNQQTYTTNETLDVTMKFGAKNIYVTDNIKQLNVTSSFGETFINAENIKHDLEINLHGKFGEINLKLPENSYVIDNTSISFGESKPKSRHGNGPVITINGKFSFGNVKY